MKKLILLILATLTVVASWAQYADVTKSESISGTWTFVKGGVQASFVNPAKPLERVEMEYGRFSVYRADGSKNTLFKGYGDSFVNFVTGNFVIGTNTPITNLMLMVISL